jgi:hypothetical protein
LPELKHQRSERAKEHADLFAQLDDDYTRRCKRYRSFLRKLTPSRTTSAKPYVDTVSKDDSTERLATEPLPLSNDLHEFFLRLFRR